MSNLIFYLRLLWAIISISVLGVLTWVLTDLPGYFLVPLIIFNERRIMSPVTHMPITTGPKWLWLWCNDQEGNDPEWYRVDNPGWPHWFRAYVWLALRNPSNNLRFVSWFSPSILQLDTSILVRGPLTLLWSGCRYRILWIIKPGIALLAGFKLAAPGVPLNWQLLGVGFGIRIKRF